MQEKWNAWYSKIYYYCLSSTSYIRLVMNVARNREALSLRCVIELLKYNNGRVFLDIRSLFTDPLFSLKSPLSAGDKI